MAVYLLIIDLLCWAATIGASASGLLAVVGLVQLGRPKPQQAQRRRRWYREQIQRGRQVLTVSPEDQRLAEVVLAMNLRQSARRRVFLPAQIRHQGASAAMNCSVLDLSDTGARLAFGHAINLPREIELEISKANRSVRAAVVWQRDNTCGVRFIEEVLSRPIDHVPAPSQQRQVA